MVFIVLLSLEFIRGGFSVKYIEEEMWKKKLVVD